MEGWEVGGVEGGVKVFGFWILLSCKCLVEMVDWSWGLFFFFWLFFFFSFFISRVYISHCEEF